MILSERFIESYTDSVDILRIDHSPLPDDVLEFLQNQPRGNWFTKNILIPVPSISGNSAFILFIARDELAIVGIIVAIIYYRVHLWKINADPFRIQVNSEPIISENSIEPFQILQKLLISLNKYADEQSHLEETEFRNFSSSNGIQSVFASQGYIFHPHLNLIKPLTNPEDAWASLSKCRRRQIKKALNNNTRIEPAKSIDQVKAFYKILHELYQHKIQKKVPSLDTFLGFFKRSQDLGDGIILLVLLNEEVIGGIVCPIEPGKKMYEWYICGLDKKYHENYPSVMATWGAITYACEHNIPEFDFMGLGKPEIPYGVRDFKLRFGGNVANYGRFHRYSPKIK
jgi:hypothetical protein